MHEQRFVLRGGRVSDVGVPGRDATAVRIEHGRVVAVGGDELVDEAAAAQVPVLDAGRRFISPGFIDAHAHVEISATADQTLVDCRYPTCRTIADVLDQLRDGLQSKTVDGWLVGQANLFWSLKLEEQRYPTRQELDSVSRDVAIAIRAGGHVTILNTRAFELSDVTRYEGQSAMYGKAVIERDGGGELTGLIAELDAALPLPALDPSTMATAIERGARQLFTRFGVTAVGEISDSQAGLSTLDALVADGRLPLRLAVYLWTPGTLPTVEEACAWDRHLTFRSPEERFAVHGVKLFADGGYSSSNAALLTRYEPDFALEPGSCGDLNLTREALADALRTTAQAGLVLAVHANGERAQEVVCAAAEDVAAEGLEPRLRVEHAGNVVTDAGTPARWRRAGAGIVPTPAFLYIGFGDFLPQYMGAVGRHGRFPFRRLLDEGWSVPASSDVHLGADPRQTNPMFGIWCAMKRETFLGAIVEPEQAIGLDEAWHMHTLASAAAIGRDDDLGSLEPGKRADVIVLERDPADVPVDELPDLQVDAVFVDGALGHTRAGAQPLA
jgi:predicted amidohydrolase YtcJ